MNPYFLIGAGLAVVMAFGSGYYKGESAGEAVIQQKWDKDIARQEKEFAEAQEAMRLHEQNLQENADRLRQEKDREIRNINARATALANSLQYRPESPAKEGGVSDPAGVRPTATGCTGAGLYRSDGEFLVREAARANQLREELKQCVQQYNAAKVK